MAAAHLLTIMGSGETTATMVPVHRSVFERLGDRPLVAVLDTPYGFQENADELTARTVDYFHTSLPMAAVEVASLRSAGAPAPARERALDTLRRAQVVFSGPGSPSYALRVWAGTPVAGILADKITGAGALTFASAASITLGRFSLPVYEIYKVGAEPHWLEGLDVLGAAGISAAVVPHWDNAEGGTHDTSRCWLGARRFEDLRSRLPAGVGVLGIDEHTACLLDPAEGRLTVAGKGTVTLITGAGATVLGPGDSAPLSLLGAAGAAGPVGGTTAPGTPPTLASLQGDFWRAVEAGDTGAALDAILSLEDAHQTWGNEAAAAAHSSLLAMVTRFAAVMAGLRLDDTAHSGAVEALLGVRARARADGRWEDADAIRRALGLLSVEVRDTPDGTVWEPLGR
jgi:hypothetical protein